MGSINFMFYLILINCAVCVHIVCGAISNDARDLILSAKEKVAMEKFKAEVINLLADDFMKTDFYLIRWIRVANLDLQLAKRLLLQTVQWRNDKNISSILSEDFSDMELDFPISHDGHDKEGRPILSLNIGDWDLRLASIQGKIPRVQRYLLQAVELAQEALKRAQVDPTNLKKGKFVTRVMVLMDVDGFNAVQHGCIQCLAVFGNWAFQGETYYPRFNEEIIIINAPTVAVITLNGVIRPFLSEERRSLLKIFDSNKHNWIEYLDKRIDRRERTVRYGGTRS